MRISFGTFHKVAALLVALFLFTSASSAKVNRHKASSKNVKHVSTKSKHGKKSRTKKVRGQRAIDDARAREIQTALIREHYLDGEPTGNWDQRTKQAMQKYQAANGWQTKMVPDSRALIKLGLGPSRENLLNPETAATTSLVPAPMPASAADAPGGPSAPQSFRQ